MEKHTNKFTISHLIHSFDQSIEGIPIPEKLNFPFVYEPHSLCLLAAQKLQNELEKNPWNHNFGLNQNQNGPVIGKMFGVLVVQSRNGTLNYLQAFSGKLADSNEHEGFVPPIFDTLLESGFYKKEEEILISYCKRIEALVNETDYLNLKHSLQTKEKQKETELLVLLDKIKINKQQRKTKRLALDPIDIQSFEKLRKESINEQYQLKNLKTEFQLALCDLKEKFEFKNQEIEKLKEERKTKSQLVQKQLFDSYTFLNHRKESKSLLQIFNALSPKKPIAGTGECCAPKLLQFAYQNDLKPIAIAEFWWGESPKSEIKKHRNFYGACKGKCEPVLGHMLEGLDVEDNPLLTQEGVPENLEIIYEDEDLVAVNKPAEFLSVPGKILEDCVFTRLCSLYDSNNLPMVVHRLDMSTSGILLFAKNKESHLHIQKQFLKHKIQKTYEAILDGIVTQKKGEIKLPLRLDMDDRPRQLVDFDQGKFSFTSFIVKEIKSQKTRIHFFPHTGRTHQLRVHAAHKLGLNAPILGDDLYGTRSNRLHLHATEMTLIHPKTKEKITLKCPCPF